jgi:WD40 repeat protein
MSSPCRPPRRPVRRLRGLLAGLPALLLSLRLCAAEPPAEPQLRLETGMHTAMINRLGTDAAGRWVVTASDDKTARVWDAQSGQLLQVLRPPLGPGDEGKLYAVAMAPNGQLVAVGGWTGWDWDGKSSVYLFERNTGRLVRRLGGLPNVTSHLAISPDGAFLAAVLGSGGLRVWRLNDFTLAAEDTDYGDRSLGAAFASDGRLVTTSYDGFVRLYDRDFRRVRQAKPPGGQQPHLVAWSPDGDQLAVGFNNSTAVNVLAATDLSLVRAPDTPGGANGYLSSVTFSLDGQSLYAGGRWKADGLCSVRRWSQAGAGAYTDAGLSIDSLMDLQPRPEGGLFYAAGDPAWGVLTAADQRQQRQGPPMADFRGDRSGFRLDAGATTVGFGFEGMAQASARFSLTNRTLTLGPVPEALRSPRVSVAGLAVTDWEHKREPKLSGQPLKLNQYEFSRSLACAADGRSFLLGCDWSLRQFDRSGKERWQQPVPEVVWAVNLADDGRLAVAAYADGTIRWHRLSDGRELLAFFPHADRQRWVLWTPEGYYDCSPGAEDLIGWHVNNGKDAAADFFPASRFRETKYRPDVIDRVLETLDVGEALRLANADTGRKARQEVDLRKQLPPVVTLLSPAAGTTVTETNLTVRFRVRSPSGEAVKDVRVLVNGRPVEGTRAVGKVQALAPQGAVGGAEEERELAVTIPAADCEVAVLAENRFAASEPAVAALKWAGRKPASVDLVKPVLYVLAIGVSDYAQDDLDLKFAAKDATDFATILRLQQGGLYREVVAKVLTDKKATAEDVRDGLEWIEKEATSRDVAMVFLAGHGENDPNGTYYFLPHNANPAKLKSSCVSFADIQTTLRNLPGKALFFVDTCHAGNVMGKQVLVARRRGGADINALANELSSAENGVVVFTACTSRQSSLEREDWQNGAFTKALVEGLSGQADLHRQGHISINTLDAFVANRVKQLTDGKQSPVTTKPDTVPDYPVAVVK